MATCKCPKCQRVLQSSGVVTVEGLKQPAPVFQCDECIHVFDFGGEPFEGALTFALLPSGAFIDPGSLEPVTFDAPAK